MEAEKVTRKLAAILYADVAGYSRLTGTDEVATHRALSVSLDAISAAVEEAGGQVLHYAGDAILAEFSSVIVAVTCANQIQRDLATRNQCLPQDRQLLFRIGINLGDVIVDRGELYGDGVNIAARLESLAAPGGICVSGAVYDLVHENWTLNSSSSEIARSKTSPKPYLSTASRTNPRPSAKRRRLLMRSTRADRDKRSPSAVGSTEF